MANEEKVKAKYGVKWFRVRSPRIPSYHLHPNASPQIWEYFLAASVIASRQGTATCFMITMHKNLNSFHRIEGVPTQHGLQAALAAPKPALE